MTVYKIGNGKKGWYFITRVNGKQVKRMKWNGQSMLTKNEALAAEREFIQDNEFSSCKIDLYSLFDEFVSASKSNLKPSTQNTYTKFKRLFLSLIPNVDIKKLTSGMILEWKNQVISKDISCDYKNRTLKVMKRVLEYGTLMYNLKGNLQYCLLEPYKDNLTLIQPKEKTMFIVEEDFKAMLEYLDLNKESDYYYFVILNVLYYTGMRIGELAALTINDFKNHSLYINKNYIRVAQVDYIQPPKSKNSVRTIKLDSATDALLENYVAKFKPTDVLFRRDAQYVNQQKIGRILKRLGTILGFDEKYELHPHSLRHSHSSNLHQLGIDEYSIAKRLGNTPAVSASTYIHVNDDFDIDKIRKKESQED